MIVAEGWPLVLLPACLGVAAVSLGWPAFGWASVAFAAASLYVFRNPPRSFDGPPEVALAPADGTVELVEAPEDGPIRLVIRIPPTAPQVTRLPVAARLEEIGHESAAGGLLRECSTSLWATAAGPLTIRQIAGRFGRRIVFDHRAGDRVERGQRIGMLRFGSRVEVVLPPGASPTVETGARVRAGATPVARFGP